MVFVVGEAVDAEANKPCDITAVSMLDRLSLLSAVWMIDVLLVEGAACEVLGHLDQA
jgi:hypothetical protein